MKYLSGAVARMRGILNPSAALDQRADAQLFATGQLLAQQALDRTGTRLSDHEFKVFSQWGEDGIIQKLVRHLDIPGRTFIEFGVQDFRESNCRFLLMHNNWQGMVIDGCPKNIRRVRQSPEAWRHHLNPVCAFIDAENITGLIAGSGFGSDVGILSVDIDGVDYWVLNAIQDCSPRILIVEYNSLFGPERAISVPYDARFQRTRKHWSNLYFGASLAAFHHLAASRGYSLIGTNSAGINAFFVRNDLLPSCPFRPLTVDEAFLPDLVCQSRDASGRLTHLRGDDRLGPIKGLPVVNVVTGAMETL